VRRHITHAESAGNPELYFYPLIVEHAVTADMPDGQSLPPYNDRAAIWRVVRRVDGHTTWRRIFLSPSLVTDWRTASGDPTRAP